MKYTYKNDIGRIKCIEINENENMEYEFGIIDMEHGEFLGAGKMTKEQWETFKEHYGIKEE